MKLKKGQKVKVVTGGSTALHSFNKGEIVMFIEPVRELSAYRFSNGDRNQLLQTTDFTLLAVPKKKAPAKKKVATKRRKK